MKENSGWAMTMSSKNPLNALQLRTPEVPVSWGELVDKITILEIKSVRIVSEEARRNVLKELGLLEAKVEPLLDVIDTVVDLKQQLLAVNEALWEIEDEIRKREAEQTFDEAFIQLARSVYMKNDERARIKKLINTVSFSELQEEKGYKPYGRG